MQTQNHAKSTVCMFLYLLIDKHTQNSNTKSIPFIEFANATYAMSFGIDS